MKCNSWGVLISFFLVFVLIAGEINSNTIIGGQKTSFCQTLLSLIESGREGFDEAKGEEVTRIITGSRKKYYVSKIGFNDSLQGYINDFASYPEYECILATDTRISETLASAYQNYKSNIMDCLSGEWTITEYDSTNNFYLKGTKFKKLVGIENAEGIKMKLHLYLYSSMIEKKRVVELKIEGTGK